VRGVIQMVQDAYASGEFNGTAKAIQESNNDYPLK
jgi:hypothetical protein